MNITMKFVCGIIHSWTQTFKSKTSRNSNVHNVLRLKKTVSTCWLDFYAQIFVWSIKILCVIVLHEISNAYLSINSRWVPRGVSREHRVPNFTTLLYHCRFFDYHYSFPISYFPHAYSALYPPQKIAFYKRSCPIV